MIGFQSRTAPRAVIQQLRAIDPTVDLVYVAEDAWMLGAWRPNDEAQGKARRRLDKLLETPPKQQDEIADRLAVLELCARGFRPIALYEDLREPDERVVRDFRERDDNWRLRARETMDQKLDEAEENDELEARKATMLDYVQSEFRSVFRHTMKAAVSRLQGSIAPVRSSVRNLIRSIR